MKMGKNVLVPLAFLLGTSTVVNAFVSRSADTANIRSSRISPLIQSQRFKHLHRLYDPKIKSKIYHSSVSVVKHNEEDEIQIKAPTVKSIISFAIPAIGIWLCSPLLSLIDTGAVGMLSGTAQQAALNPAITITDDGSLLVSFMFTASTNLVAAAYESDRVSGNKDRAPIIITLLQLSLIVGIIFGVGLSISSTFFIKALLGKGKNIDQEVLAAAEQYVRIRAIGMPATVLTGVAQSACLGMKDTTSPLIVMLTAAFINFVGDLVFVGRTGAAGAAMATVLSQYAALAMFLQFLRCRPSKDEGNESSSRGILHQKFRTRDFFREAKCKRTVKEVAKFFVPVTATAIGRVSGYIAMSHVVSSAFGTIDMAAQQIVLSLFLCFIPMCDSLNLTAQSFVPGIHEYKKDLKLRAEVMKETTKNFMKAGSYFGLAISALVSTLPAVINCFTRDAAVITSVTSTLPYLWIFCLFAGVVCSGEGLLLGTKDLNFLKNSFSVFFFVIPFFMLRIKKAILVEGQRHIKLAAVWRIFAVYQVFRSCLWMFRLRVLSQKDHAKANENA